MLSIIYFDMFANTFQLILLLPTVSLSIKIK